jgi:hypothetical protein
MLPCRWNQDPRIDNTEKHTPEQIIQNAKEWIINGSKYLEEDLERNDFYTIMGTLEEMLYYANSADTIIRLLKHEVKE